MAATNLGISNPLENISCKTRWVGQYTNYSLLMRGIKTERFALFTFNVNHTFIHWFPVGNTRVIMKFWSELNINIFCVEAGAYL